MKSKERDTARILYVEQGKTAKDIAELLGVSEKTISAWVQKYAWKAARTANVTGRQNRIESIKMIIDGFAQQRLDINAQLNDLVKSGGDKDEIANLRQELARIDSGVANWNKTLEQVDKESRVSLSTYLYVMDRVFKSLQAFDTKIYINTVPFQEHHINEIAIELG